MKFVPNWKPRAQAEELPVVLRSIVNSAPDYHDGRLEGLERQVAALLDLVVSIADQLPDKKKEALAHSLGYNLEED